MGTPGRSAAELRVSMGNESTPGVEADPTSLSRDARDKLQAVLNYGWEGTRNDVPKAYLDACARWYRSLGCSDQFLAKKALRAHARGDDTAALLVASELPPAPKPPLR
jgi:hypothetical protein